MPHPEPAYAVSGIYERDRRLLEFLEARGIRPGAKLRLLERNYDQTLSLSTAAGNVSLGRAAAERVWVSPADPRSYVNAVILSLPDGIRNLRTSSAKHRKSLR